MVKNELEQNISESHIPWLKVFYENVKSKLELGQLTSENIVQFQEVLCLTPRYV
jgi:structure-specific recognition protein 1